MMLTHPHTGARVRCMAHKRWALATDVPDDPRRLTVLLRTDNADKIGPTARREAKRLGQPVHIFRMAVAAEFYGSILPDGSTLSVQGHRSAPNGAPL
jgi:hypothetical protein